MCIHAESTPFCRYGRSYDVSLVQRKYLGKVIIAFNIMWKYREQVSFGVSGALGCHTYGILASRLSCAALKLGSMLQLSEEEYMDRLDGVAAALR